VGARPELRDLRSSLVTPGGLVADVVTLSGLDAGAAMRLAANVIGAADLPAAVAAKVLATSEGNPLFVGELVRMLVDQGAIERRGERWIVGANLATLEMPPTIHALLAARIERLGPEDRTVLERAAVVGRHFSRSAVAALLGRNGSHAKARDASDLDARLEALRRTELIERDTGWFLGEPVLRFHHVLIRDAAYRRLLKGTRAELHEQLADWIEARGRDAPEHDETIGWHLEQAHQHRRELGPLDAQGTILGERAARRLAAAGRRALARDDLPVAADLLGRALERLAADDPARAELALDWCEALLAGGDVGTAETAIAELGRFAGGPAAGRDPRLAAWHTCFTGQLTVLTTPQALHSTADAVAAAADELASLDDAAGEAKAHFVHALALARLGRIGGCEAALDKALAAARRADDRRRANTVLAIAPLAALWGPSPVTRASGRCLDVVRVLRITQGAPAVEAVALSCQAVLEALRGRTEAARRMIASARKMVEDLGITQRLLEADVFGGLIDLLEGDAAAAEHSLRRAYDGFRDLGLGIDAARAAALLARPLLAEDRGAEAEALSHESEALAGDDLKAAIAWRVVRAEALARRGEHTPAIGLANAAVEIAAATDALLDHADARLALAAALRAAGRGREADAEEQRAVALWEAKGATVLAGGARRRGTSEPQNDPRPLPEGDHREVGPPPAPRLANEGEPSRRVQPNAATAMLVRLHAHLAARDFDAVAKDSREDMESIDHPSGSSYGREAIVASLRRFFRSRDPHYEAEPLATLGDFLVLARRHTSASGGGGGRFDVGAYENDALELFEVDASGKTSRTEVFAADKLGAAVARLYERHAELLPEKHDRERAAATARSVAGWIGPIDPDRLATTMTPSMEMVDHRNLGTWSTRGAAEFLDHNRLQAELAMGFTGRTDGVLALAPGALLVRCTYFGIARDSGGAFENVLLQLFAFGADGLIARSELWEPDLDAEALARFDALTAGAGDAGTLAAGIQEGVVLAAPGAPSTAPTDRR
jgi:tetratricopeptide (TPR) repeat protein